MGLSMPAMGRHLPAAWYNGSFNLSRPLLTELRLLSGVERGQKGAASMAAGPNRVSSGGCRHAPTLEDGMDAAKCAHCLCCFSYRVLEHQLGSWGQVIFGLTSTLQPF